jgi:hypothetical protein
MQSYINPASPTSLQIVSYLLFIFFLYHGNFLKMAGGGNKSTTSKSKTTLMFPKFMEAIRSQNLPNAATRRMAQATKHTRREPCGSARWINASITEI